MVLAGFIPSTRSGEESVSLPFLTARGCLHSLVHGPIIYFIFFLIRCIGVTLVSMTHHLCSESAV